MNPHLYKPVISKIILFLSLSLVLPQLSLYAQKPICTVKIADGKYMDETEIDVGSWLSYYTWVLNRYGYEAAQKVLPDSTRVEPELFAYIKKRAPVDLKNVFAKYSMQPIGNFRDKCSECAKFGKRLYEDKRSCAMLSFPITGITYEQALGFCEWRTKIQSNGKLIFRLPTPQEWEEGALISLPETERVKRSRDSLYLNQCPTFNYYTANVYPGSCFPNGKLNGIGIYFFLENKIFDMFGNVSEMTSTKGIAKGGNFRVYASQCHTDSVQPYESSQSWLGFRCVAVKRKAGTLLSEEHIPTTNHSLGRDKYGRLIDARDGKIYRTIQIGNQTWLAENLAYKPASGDYWSWNNDTNYVSSHGYLYTWETAKDVCPEGWHLPGKEEFDSLLYTVGKGNPRTTYNELIESGSSGFSINLAVGTRFGRKNFSTMESAFWASTEKNRFDAWCLYFDTYDRAFEVRTAYKNYGHPVRCTKNK